MPQRQDNAGAVCDSGMVILFSIVNFCRTEGYCTKKWGRILPGFYWYHQKESSYVVRHLATLPIFDQSEAKKLAEIHVYTDTGSTYCQALLYEQHLKKRGVTFCFGRTVL